jgi:hypothetical protein
MGILFLASLLIEHNYVCVCGLVIQHLNYQPCAEFVILSFSTKIVN